MADMTNDIILQAENLNKQYYGNGGGTTPLSIFDDFNLTCYKHQITSIVGPSGCGKSSLLNMISELDIDYTGTITKNIQHMVGYIFQDDALIPWKTVADNIMLGVRLKNGDTQDWSFCEDLMRQYGLYEYKEYFPQMLSGGMRQKVALAQMMINKPELVLLDEPFSSQDFFTKIQLENLFYKNIRENKLSAILVTHDIDEATYMSDKVFVMTGSPAGFTTEIDIKLPKPRSQSVTRSHPDFLNIRSELYKNLRR